MSTVRLYGDNIKAYKWQLDSHKVITDHISKEDKHQKVIVIKSTRQRFGKSTFAKAELLRFSLGISGSINAYVSPTLKLARKMYDEIVKATDSFITKKNSLDMIIEFNSGSVLRFFSGEMKDSLRGFTVSGILVIDEAAYINDDVYYELLSPWTTVKKALTVIISTPRYKSGFYYDLYMKGLDDSNFYKTLDWVRDYDCPMDDFTLSLRDTMPSQKWRSEYLGLFLDAEGSVFGDFSSVLIDNPTDDSELYIGIDFGTGSGKDDTVVTAVNSKGEQVAIWSCNDKSPTEQVELITKELLSVKNKIKFIYAEQNSIGKIYLDMLKNKGFNITPFNTTNDSKRELVEMLQVAIDQKQISILRNIKQIDELTFFESKLNNNNKITFNASYGHNDDYVIALMLAYKGYRIHKYGGQYNLSFLNNKNKPYKYDR